MNNYKFIFGMLILVFVNSAYGLSIKNVSHDKGVFDPVKGNAVKISFELDEKAFVRLSIFDARETLVRKIDTTALLEAGQHSILWDGRDQARQIVPAEAYHYTINAFSQSGESVEYDPSDATIGKTMYLKGAVWDSTSGFIKFKIAKPSRVSLRIGLGGDGPLMATILNWSILSAGQQKIKWDGMASSNSIDLSHHKNIRIGLRAYSLSVNTILTGKPKESLQFIENISWPVEKRIKKQKTKKRMFTFHLQDKAQLGDFPVTLKPLRKLKVSNDGTLMVTDKITLKLDVPNEHRERIAAQRYEIVFYIDGQFIGESEMGIFPMAWHWEPKGINTGVHYITANVRGYEGNFGTATLKIFYKPTINARQESRHTGAEL